MSMMNPWALLMKAMERRSVEQNVVQFSSFKNSSDFIFLEMLGKWRKNGMRPKLMTDFSYIRFALWQCWCFKNWINQAQGVWEYVNPDLLWRIVQFWYFERPVWDCLGLHATTDQQLCWDKDQRHQRGTDVDGPLLACTIAHFVVLWLFRRLLRMSKDVLFTWE